MPQTTTRLAIDGGPPVRTEPFPHMAGAELIGEEEKQAVLEVLEAKSLFRYSGPNLLGKVAAFERDFAAFTGARHALGLSSGTAALRVGLAALDVGPGDEVIVPAVTFIASVSAIIAQGAVPRFAEVDETFCLDPDHLEAAIEPRTRAIMAVHLGGTAARIDRIAEIARKHDLALIEDCAQSVGVTYKGTSVGRFGGVGAFSFQLSKNITAGEGGAVVSDDTKLFGRAAQFQDQGGQFTRKAAYPDQEAEPLLGENLRMTETAGAILGVQLTRLSELARQQRAVRDRIVAGLERLPGIKMRRGPDPAGEIPSGVGFFVDTAEKADRMVAALRAEGAPARKVYGGHPVYANPAILEQRTISRTGRPFTDPLYIEKGPPIQYRMGMCPRSEDLLGRCIVLAVNHAYTEKDTADIVEAVSKVWREMA